ncbi:MAG: hypothetical protein OEY94_05035 [Alphaproteobacteria bacterium]|nr:hypothetical protein [Alphaproteobacteria bacterium]
MSDVSGLSTEEILDIALNDTGESKGVVFWGLYELSRRWDDEATKAIGKIALAYIGKKHGEEIAIRAIDILAWRAEGALATSIIKGIKNKLQEGSQVNETSDNLCDNSPRI